MLSEREGSTSSARTIHGTSKDRVKVLGMDKRRDGVTYSENGKVDIMRGWLVETRFLEGHQTVLAKFAWEKNILQ